jgi:N-methylhydantoinase A/oxoprolinase/acetone carboxylase beta subunit
VTASFEERYRALYSRTPLGVPIEVLNWRVVVSGPAPEISVARGATAHSGLEPSESPLKRTRRAYFPEIGDYLETPVYDRYRLAAGAAREGPAIIEERESTTVIGPGARIRVDRALTIIAEPA